MDEGDAKVRARNDRALQGIPRSYWGPAERLAWFREWFGSGYEGHSSLIPKKTIFPSCTFWKKDLFMTVS